MPTRGVKDALAGTTEPATAGRAQFDQHNTGTAVPTITDPPSHGYSGAARSRPRAAYRCHATASAGVTRSMRRAQSWLPLHSEGYHPLAAPQCTHQAAY